LSHRRHAIAAKQFLKKLIKGNPTGDRSVLNTDKNPAYGHAIRELKQEGTLDNQLQHLPINY
jgi:IS6 family transposase